MTIFRRDYDLYKRTLGTTLINHQPRSDKSRRFEPEDITHELMGLRSTPDAEYHDHLRAIRQLVEAIIDCGLPTDPADYTEGFVNDIRAKVQP